MLSNFIRYIQPTLQLRWRFQTDAGRRCISFSKLTIEKNPDDSRLSKMPKKEDLKFGALFSNHMLMIEWDEENKWSAPKIVPIQDLKLSPAASVLHYGLECFEGMKAYKSLSDPSKVLLFRPELNMQRLINSMNRLELSTEDLDPDELLKCIKQLVYLDKDWIPQGEGYSLYLRPTVISTYPYLGVVPSKSMLLYVITSPSGPYLVSKSFQPVRLTCDTKDIRAWPGGTGASKIGGNYGPTIKASTEAAKAGFNQVLWLYGEKDEITEVGSMNIFFLIQNAQTGRQELCTPPLDRGDILPGVTRRSILELTRSDAWKGEYDVVERYPTMPEICKAASEGRFIEAFGAGTAAVVSPIECIQYKGEIIFPTHSVGDVTKRVHKEVTAIQYGQVDGHEWSVEIKG